MKKKKLLLVHVKNGELYCNNIPFAKRMYQYAIEYAELCIAFNEENNIKSLETLPENASMEVHPDYIEIKGEKAYVTKTYY